MKKASFGILCVLSLALAIGVQAKSPAPPKEITVSAQPGGDYANVTIRGEAAKTIYDTLANADQTTVKKGSLITTVRSGRNIKCGNTTSAGITYSCTFGVDSRGEVFKEFVK